MKRYALDDLEIGGFFSLPVYLDEDFILLTPDTPVTRELVDRLKSWLYSEVLSDGQPCENPLLNENGISSETGDSTSIGGGLTEEERAYTVYSALVDFINDIMKTFAVTTEVNVEAITTKIRETITDVREKKDFILALISRSEPHDNYLIIHLANTTLLSLAIGDYMKLPHHRLIELGLCAILHEIGMTKIPEELYMSADPLSAQEKTTIMAHTVLGYRILKSLSVSESVARGVLEYQERLDGSGYPNHLTGDSISLYARILAVSCSYDAMISKRPYKDASNGHHAMLQLLKNERKLYDERALKALIYSLSFYPLGTQVVLSSDMSGVVYKSNPEDPKLPIVKLLFDQNGAPLIEPLLVQTSQETNLVIKRIVDVKHSDM